MKFGSTVTSIRRVTARYMGPSYAKLFAEPIAGRAENRAVLQFSAAGNLVSGDLPPGRRPILSLQPAGKRRRPPQGDRWHPAPTEELLLPLTPARAGRLRHPA